MGFGKEFIVEVRSFICIVKGRGLLRTPRFIAPQFKKSDLHLNFFYVSTI